MNFIACNVNGTKIITGHDNGSIILWDRTIGSTRSPSYSELKTAKGNIRMASFTHDGKLLATAGKDSLIYIWNLDAVSHEPIKIIQTLSAIKTLVLCNADSLIVALVNGNFLLWDLQNSTYKSIFASTDYHPLSMAWNQKDKILVVGCSNGILIALYLAKGSKIPPRKFEVHTSGIDLLSFNNDYTLLASGCWDKTINLYHFENYFESLDMTGKAFQRAIQLSTLGNRGRSMIFTKDDKLVVGMSDKTIHIWDCSSQNLAEKLCLMIKLDMSKDLWNQIIGDDIPYEKPCFEKP
jgi:WD40 repeat protein